MTRRPAPISLRIRNVEIHRQARGMLLRLEADQLRRRRIKLQATKACIAIREMTSLMSTADRNLCRAEYEQALSFLKRVSDRGSG